MSAPAYVPCRCGCRPVSATRPGCPCPECQPGPGLEHAALRKRNSQVLETRMLLLIHRETLTDDESSELDGLLNWYIHR